MSVAEDTPATRVLLVEYSTQKTVAIPALLARVADARFVVEEADSLTAALLRLTSGGIDIVLLDSRLPDSYGLQGLGTVRSRFPDIPVIMLAGSADKQWAPHALRMGAKDWVVKDSIDGRLLARIILRHIKKA